MLNTKRLYGMTAAILMMVLGSLSAQTVHFEKPDGVDWADSSAYIDSITTDVGITRDYYEPIFNGFTETYFNEGESPEGTLWASGPTPATANPLTYAPFDVTVPSNERFDLAGRTLSLFLVEDSLFFDVQWTSWSSGGDGGFAYDRTPVPAPVFDNDTNVVYFQKENYASSDSVNWDWISDNVAIWRDESGPLYNPVMDEEGPIDGVSPAGTFWAFGPVPAEVTPFHFGASFDQVVDGNREDLPGQILSMHVPENDTYWDVEFVSWTNNQDGGGFSYIRRPVEPSVVSDPNAIYFQKPNYAEASPENFDWVTDSVAIWRNESGRIFNAVDEEGPEEGLSPTRTLWARGPTPAEVSPIHYAQFDDAYPRNEDGMRNIVGQVMSLYIPDSNLYFDVEWFIWTPNRDGGGFAYSRTPVSAPTVVTDPDVVYFRNLNYSDVTDPDVWDVISDSVAIIRGSRGPIYNPIFEDEASNFSSPVRTTWSAGPTAEQMYLSSYSDFLSAAGGEYSLRSLPGRTFSLYVEDSDTYYDVNFISWKSGGGGGFAYMRTEEAAPEFMDESDWTYYLKPANSSASDSADWDWISDNVALYRGDSGPIYNAALEDGAESGLSPVNTFWAPGFTPAQADPFTYVPFQHLVPHGRRDIPGHNMSLMVVEMADTAYYDVQWLTWTSDETGGFSYLRREAEAPEFHQEPDAVYFIKYDGMDGSDSLWQDMISDSVAITSDDDGIYNAMDEDYYQEYLSPKRTMWANGPTAMQHHSWDYMNFQSAVGNDNDFEFYPGQIMSLWIPEENLFFDIEWWDWTDEDGGFAYIRRDATAPTFEDDPLATYFIKEVNTSSSDTTQWDMIIGDIAITRDNYGPIFNPILEESHEEYVSPLGTRWAMGTTAGQVTPYAYAPFENVVSDNERRALPGRTLSLYLPDHDLYFDVNWITWTTSGTGGFSYVRTPAAPPEYPMDPAVVHFIKHDYADPMDSTAQDRITPEVWVTRDDDGPLFNAYSEEGYNYENGSPEGTMWALGTTDSQNSQWDYSYFDGVVGDGERTTLPGQTMSLFIPGENLYFDVEWLTWKSNRNGGGFSYRRTEVTEPMFEGDSGLVFYEKEDYAVLDSALLWDVITDSVAIYRGDSGPLYNPILEPEYEHEVSPARTLWARGLTEDAFSPSQYQAFGITVGSGERQDLPGNNLSLWIPDEDLFFDIRFMSWTSNEDGGGFSYNRRPAEMPESFSDSSIVFFQKQNYSDHEDPDTWDWISNTVAITRGWNEPIYNGALETSFESGVSPERTLWADGPTEDVRFAEMYAPFDAIVGDGQRRDLPGRTLSLFLMDDSLYFDVTWLSWSRSGGPLRDEYGAGFSYVRQAVETPTFEYNPDAVLFVKPDGSPNVLPYMDMISPEIIITRGYEHPIYNAALETEYIWGQSPTNTLWTYGPTSEVEQELEYRVFDAVVGNGERRELPGRLMSLYLPLENRYFDVEWLSWSRGDDEGNNGFSYLRLEVDPPVYEIDPTAVFFEKPDGADPADSTFWDMLAPGVAITRGEDGPIYNPHTESYFIPGQSPTGTFWANGPTDGVFAPQEYVPFDQVVGNGQRRDLPGRVLSLWIPDTDMFYDVQWVSWSNGRSDDREGNPGFSYLRTPVAPPQYVQNPDMVYFMRSAYATGTGPDNVDHISENVAITRGNHGGYIFNAYLDFDDSEAAAPTGTFWARGLTSDQTSMDAYAPFGTTWDDGERRDIPGQVSSLYVEEIDAFFDVYWRSWGQYDGGTFSYARIPAGHLFREASSDWMDPEFQDRVADDVALTRLPGGGVLINADTETAPTNGLSPEGTLWARGMTADQENQAAYMDLKSAMSNRLRDLPGETLSMYVMSTGLYYDVYFETWGSGGGAVEYFRSWAKAPTFLPQAPGDFEMHADTDPIVIDYDNLATGALALSWDASIDPDGDDVSYHITLSLDTLQAAATIVDSMLDGTDFEISYQLLAQAMDLLEIANGEVTWMVYALDDMHMTPAANGPLQILIDSSPLSAFSDLAVPDQFTLEQNYPNPFNPMTNIRFGIPEQSDVQMVIYDIKGRQIQSLEMKAQPAGWYEYVWNGATTNGEHVSTGLYFCRLQAGSYSETIKMVYLK